jgi:hypothetical protein
MLKPWLLTLIVMISSSQFVLAAPTAFSDQKEASTTEVKECEVSGSIFARRLRESGDFGPLLSDLFVSDFIERFINEQVQRISEEHKGETDLYFVPGLDYNSHLLRQAPPEEWRRLYVASHSFIYQGFASGIAVALSRLEKNGEIENLEESEMYPQDVIDLLEKDPILTNLIKMKDLNRSVNTREELVRVTKVLEQALLIIREKQGKGFDKKQSRFEKMWELKKEKGDLKPRIEIAEREYFGYPKGTRFCHVVTPVMFQLTLVRAGGVLKIVWAEPFVGD